MPIREPYRGAITATPEEQAQIHALQDGFAANALARYPDAAAAWRVSVSQRPPATTGFDWVAAMPWLPYLPALIPSWCRFVSGSSVMACNGPGYLELHAHFGWTSFPWPLPGPADFNFGGNATFSNGAQGFFGEGVDWRTIVARSGGNPDAEYMSAFVQSPAPGAGKYDYVRALYARSGAYWRPIAAYPKERVSSWDDFRTSALPALMMVISFGAAGPLFLQLGSAMLGPTFAAAYPSLASALGQTVVTTMANGGDVGAAVKSTALSAAGGFAGDFAGGAVGALSDTQLLADVADAAVTAAIKGGDPRMAVVGTLATSGASSLADLFTPSEDVIVFDDAATSGDEGASMVDYFDPVYDAPVDLQVDFATPLVSAEDYFDPVYEAPIDTSGADYSIYETPSDVPVSPGVTTWDPYGMDRAQASSSLPTPAPASGGSGIDSAIVTLTNAALAAIKINQAYQATQAQPRTSTQSGAVVKTGNANGTVTVRNTQTGASAIAKPEVGVPYTLANGSTIINNGNGTYTTIRADGSQATAAYPATLSSSSSSGFLESLKAVPTPVWIGAGVLGVLALRRAR